MAFTYTLASADPTVAALSEVRFELGDTTDGHGVRATGANITDEELAVVYNRESTSVMRTVAGLCEMLARDWSRMASISVGPRSEQVGAVAEQWAKRAAQLREQYGGGGASGYGFSIRPRRADGYAENAAGGEYGAFDF